MLDEDTISDEISPEDMAELEQFKGEPRVEDGTTDADEPSDKDSYANDIDNTIDEPAEPSTGDEQSADEPKPTPETSANANAEVDDLLSKVNSSRETEEDDPEKVERRDTYREHTIKARFKDALAIETQSELDDYLDKLPDWIKEGVDGVPGVMERLGGKKQEIIPEPEIETPQYDEDVLLERLEKRNQAKAAREKFDSDFKGIMLDLAGKLEGSDFQKVGVAVQQVIVDHPSLVKNASDLIDLAVKKAGVTMNSAQSQRDGVSFGGRPPSPPQEGGVQLPNKDPNDLTPEEIAALTPEQMDALADRAEVNGRIRSPWAKR